MSPKGQMQLARSTAIAIDFRTFSKFVRFCVSFHSLVRKARSLMGFNQVELPHKTQKISSVFKRCGIRHHRRKSESQISLINSSTQQIIVSNPIILQHSIPTSIILLLVPIKRRINHDVISSERICRFSVLCRDAPSLCDWASRAFDHRAAFPFRQRLPNAPLRTKNFQDYRIRSTAKRCRWYDPPEYQQGYSHLQELQRRYCHGVGQQPPDQDSFACLEQKIFVGRIASAVARRRRLERVRQEP